MCQRNVVAAPPARAAEVVASNDVHVADPLPAWLTSRLSMNVIPNQLDVVDILDHVKLLAWRLFDRQIDMREFVPRHTVVDTSRDFPLCLFEARHFSQSVLDALPLSTSTPNAQFESFVPSDLTSVQRMKVRWLIVTQRGGLTELPLPAFRVFGKNFPDNFLNVENEQPYFELHVLQCQRQLPLSGTATSGS